MKIILQRDVKDMGRMFDVVEAKDGYALNFLLPKKLAVAATGAALAEAAARKAQKAGRAEIDAHLLKQNIAALAEVRVTVRAKANEKGHLYDAVGAEEIARAVKEQGRIDLPESAIKLGKPFKELGTFDVPVAVGETFGKFSITIEAE